MVVLVFTATYILVFRAYGYDFNARTGQVIQDGLVYIASAPNGATVKVNGKTESNTNTRLSLPEGKYDLEISKPGYQTWKRSFELEGGQVLRFDYAVLFPDTLAPVELQAFNKPVAFSTESPDRRWILLAGKDQTSGMTLYDTRSLTNGKPVGRTINFSSNLFNSTKGPHTLKFVEWSTDNRHVLVRHIYKGGNEFVMLDVLQPPQSYNINKTINQTPDRVSLFDKKYDQLYVYNSKSRILSRADIKKKTVQTYATNVLTFKPHGDDTLLMSKIDATDKRLADIVMRQKGRDYIVKKIPITRDIPLDVARYNGHWYIIFSVESQKRAYIYKDPIDLLFNKDDNTKYIRAIVLKNKDHIDEVSFSDNARFIMSNSRKNFTIYDAQTEKHYSYGMDQIDTDQLPVWMDGHRILSSSRGKVLVFDYDGINFHTLVSADPAAKVMFDRDYKIMYTVGVSTSNKKEQALFQTQLRLPADR
jgi:hypothetical protein